MALLVDALRTSGVETAYCDPVEGVRVIVERIIGAAEPYSQEEYVVSVERGTSAPRDRIAALDLVEAFDRMRALGVPGFDPERADWRPWSASAQARMTPTGEEPLPPAR